MVLLLVIASHWMLTLSQIICKSYDDFRVPSSDPIHSFLVYTRNALFFYSSLDKMRRFLFHDPAVGLISICAGPWDIVNVALASAFCRCNVLPYVSRTRAALRLSPDGGAGDYRAQGGNREFHVSGVPRQTLLWWLIT